MDLLNVCFDGLNKDKYVELAVGGVTQGHRRWIPVGGISSLKPTPQEALYFGPAIRDKSGVMGKANCLGSQVLWTDLDRPEFIHPILPATVVVHSGNGHHLYWRLDSFQSERKVIETLNAGMAQGIKGDSCHNIDRILRVPGSANLKDPAQPLEVRVLTSNPSYIYSVEDVQASIRITDKIAKKIRTGDRRGYRSRSERDWAIVQALVFEGISDQVIERIFLHHKCGDKYRQETASYLSTTIAEARKSATPFKVIVGSKVGTGGDGGGDADTKGCPVVEKDHCYYMAVGKGAAQVSTFILEPKLLLEGDEDAIVCDVRAQGTNHVWKGEVFTKTELSSLTRLNPRLNKAAWTWLGRDAHVRQLCAYLIQQLQKKGVPLARSTSIMGRHSMVDDDRTYFVTRDAVIASDGSIWKGDSKAPIVYVPSTKNVPSITITKGQYGDRERDAIAEHLPKLHDSGRIWPMIGWYCATPMKPALEEVGYRFPILSVSGTKGSGKTTLIHRIFLRMLGYTSPKGYEANTTRFVLLALLGSSNAPPLAFSEFRANMTKDFLRYVLISYDSGMDARGRPDQTITNYPLVAPFSLDGEDQLTDPAAMERIVAVHLKKDTVLKDSPAWLAYQELSQMNLPAFAYPYILHTLKAAVRPLIELAQREVDEAFVYPMPDRVRRNLAVAWMGVRSFCDFVGIAKPAITVLRHALENVYFVARGRAPVAADDFVEFVINVAARGHTNFVYTFKSGVLWFHVTPAYHAYASHAHRMGADTLSKAAMVSQLEEMESFMVPPVTMSLEGKVVRAHGVSLVDAYKAGLDVPSEMVEDTWTIRR